MELAMTHCQLCAYEFDETQLRCHSSCPFNEHCAIICCPNCGYQVVNESKSRLAEALRRFLNYRATPSRSNQAMHCPLSQLQVGEAGKLVSIESNRSDRLERLQIFGLMPGVKVTLKQRRPEFVLEVGHTELTIEREVADELLIEVMGNA
jgi:Fe2+ transport system protein FeoA